MRQILLLPLAALLAMPVFSQTPADTTLTIRNIEIQGTRFAGLSEREIYCRQIYSQQIKEQMR